MRKAAVEEVRWAAEIIRSPSFSREGSSQTMRNSPRAMKSDRKRVMRCERLGDVG